METRQVEVIDLTISPRPSSGSDTIRKSELLRRESVKTIQSRQPDTADRTASPGTYDENIHQSVVDKSVSHRTRSKKEKKRHQFRTLEDDEELSSGTLGQMVRSETRQKERDSRRARQSEVKSPTDSALFFVDSKPQELSESITEAKKIEKESKYTLKDGLLLPNNVLVKGVEEAVPNSDTSAPADSDEENFIHRIDTRLESRYFEHDEHKSRLVCGHCGAEGKHKTKHCTVTICLTCGVLGEHTTRACPITRVCFSCGMKGHINKDCPNRRSGQYGPGRNGFCERCGSNVHGSKECPTLWRLYEYVDNAEREDILWMRREKEQLPIGKGGEGYIGEGLWCYSCGYDGHLGDDCDYAPDSHPKEPSAFSSYNMLSGPFADLYSLEVHRRRASPQRRETRKVYDNREGLSALSNVGKRGRDKERQRLRQKLQEVAADDDDDDDDWFKNRRRQESHTRMSSLGPKHMSMSDKGVNRSQKGRMDVKISIRRQVPGLDFAKKSRSHSRDSKRGRGTSSGKDRDRDRERDRDRTKDRNEDVGRTRSSNSDRKRKRDRDRGGDGDNERSRSDKRPTERRGRRYYGEYVQ